MGRLYELIEMSQHLPLIYLAVGIYIVTWVLRHPDQWQSFLNSLDTNGGHIVALMALLIIGYRMFQSDSTAGGQLITGAEAALFILLNSKRPLRSGDPPPDATSSTTVTAVATTSTSGPAAAPGGGGAPVADHPPA